MNSRNAAFGGAAVLAGGLLAPIVMMPIVGSISLFGNVFTDFVAIDLLVLAAISAALAAKGRLREFRYRLWSKIIIRFLGLGALVAFAAAQPVMAREWPSAGGWDIVEGESSCALTSEFEGPGDTELYLIRYLDGDILLSISNSNWTIKEGDEFDLTFALNGTVYNGARSHGVTLSGKRGFLAKFPPSFLKDFAKSPYIHVYRGTTVVDKLNLDGSAVALAQVEKCLAHLRAVAAAAATEKARWSGIPDNPFADSKSDPAADGPRPKFGSLAAIFTADDYPAAAIAAEQEGSVRFRLTIGTDGRVTGCAIVASSGSAALDEQTCAILRRRATFIPAADKSGKAREGSYEQTVNWRLQAAPVQSQDSH